MNIFRQKRLCITLIAAPLLLFSCSKVETTPDDQPKGTRDRNFDLYVEHIQAFTWAEPRNEYDGIKAGDKIGELSLTRAGDEASYWYDHRIDLANGYQAKWEDKTYNPTTLNVRAYRFGRLNTGFWDKQFNTEEDVQGISEEDLGIRVAVGQVPLNDALVTVYAYLRAAEK